jgi:hypothetical protein
VEKLKMDIASSSKPSLPWLMLVSRSLLPFIPDGRFFLWRLGMYLPFALFAGLLLKLRPGLLPYMIIVHGLLDISALSVYFMV